MRVNKIFHCHLIHTYYIDIFTGTIIHLPILLCFVPVDININMAHDQWQVDHAEFERIYFIAFHHVEVVIPEDDLAVIHRNTILLLGLFGHTRWGSPETKTCFILFARHFLHVLLGILGQPYDKKY